MRFGAMVATKIDDWKLLVECESLGYDHGWVPDSQMIWSDCYATLALVAANTSRMKLGTGVAIAPTRLAPVTAHSIASIARLAPGRVFLGIGTGHTAMRVMGMRPMMPREFREYLRVVRGPARERRGRVHPRRRDARDPLPERRPEVHRARPADPDLGRCERTRRAARGGRVRRRPHLGAERAARDDPPQPRRDLGRRARGRPHAARRLPHRRAHHRGGAAPGRVARERAGDRRLRLAGRGRLALRVGGLAHEPGSRSARAARAGRPVRGVLRLRRQDGDAAREAVPAGPRGSLRVPRPGRAPLRHARRDPHLDPRRHSRGDHRPAPGRRARGAARDHAAAADRLRRASSSATSRNR